MTSRRGVGLVEMIASITIAGLIAALATALIVGQARLASSGALRVETLDAMRTTALLLPLETRSLAAADMHGIAGDSAAHRVFRGLGIVCDVQGGRSTIRYRGWRDIDATKDSVLIVTRGPEVARSIVSAASSVASCVTIAGETRIDIRLSADTLRAGEVVLVFEAGAYHLATGALRYRAPGGTRQPLTADVLAGRGFGLALRAAPGPIEPLAVELALAPIARRALTRPTLPPGTIRVHLLNLSAPPDSSE